MDVRCANLFIASICNVFETMSGLKVTIGKPAIAPGKCEQTDATALIGFSGDATGSVVLCFGFDDECRAGVTVVRHAIRQGPGRPGQSPTLS